MFFECRDEDELEELFQLACRPEENPDSGLYVCDPYLNVNCSHSGCAYFGNGQCYLTCNPNYKINKTNTKALKDAVERNIDYFDHVPSIFFESNRDEVTGESSAQDVT